MSSLSTSSLRYLIVANTVDVTLSLSYSVVLSQVQSSRIDVIIIKIIHVVASAIDLVVVVVANADVATGNVVSVAANIVVPSLLSSLLHSMFISLSSLPLQVQSQSFRCVRQLKIASRSTHFAPVHPTYACCLILLFRLCNGNKRHCRSHRRHCLSRRRRSRHRCCSRSRHLIVTDAVAVTVLQGRRCLSVCLCVTYVLWPKDTS